jgi:uncharacterized protein (DUF427 family)
VNKKYLQESETYTTCAWKGKASYTNIVDEKTNQDAAWYYPQISDMAKAIQGYIAFLKGVKVVA